MVLLRTLVIAAAPIAGSAQAKDCIHSAFESDVSVTLEEAETEYPRFEAGRFAEITGHILDELPCIDDPVTPMFVSRVHRVLGLRAHIVEADALAARAAFAASRAIDPNYELPIELVGEKDREREHYYAVPPELIVTRALPRPEAGTVYLDGVETLERPVNAPVYYQRFNEEGQILEAAYLWPEDEAPLYPFVVEAAAASVVPEPRGDLARTLVTGSGAALAGVGVTMVALGGWDRTHICQELGDEACELEAKERVAVGTVLAVVGVGGAIGGAVLLGPTGPAVRIQGRW